jgi:PAS domain S-box-containing protein
VGDETHIRQVNQGWTRFLGWSKEEIINLQWTSIVHPHDLEQTIQACVGDRLPLQNFPNRYMRKDGAYVWFRWFMSFPSEEEGLFYAVGFPFFNELPDNLKAIAERRAQVYEMDKWKRRHSAPT